MNFFFVLFFILLILKLVGIIHISWVFVFLPLVPALIFLIIMLVFFKQLSD